MLYFYLLRMMSDELSSWKVTLYTKFRQAQSAIQRLLDERSQLQQYLTQTKRSVSLFNTVFMNLVLQEQCGATVEDIADY